MLHVNHKIAQGVICRTVLLLLMWKSVWNDYFYA